MSRLKHLNALAAAFALTNTLSACAIYGKCGFAGCPADTRITAEVRALIDKYPALEAPNSVRVQTMNHVVYLYGQVNTDVERATAESVARAIPGVTRIVDSISLSYAGW